MSVMPPIFEALFGIPPHPRLWLVRSRGRGGSMWGEYWTHEEVDPSGTVIARSESQKRWTALVRSGAVGAHTTPPAASSLSTPSRTAGWLTPTASLGSRPDPRHCGVGTSGAQVHGA